MSALARKPTLDIGPATTIDVAIVRDIAGVEHSREVRVTYFVTWLSPWHRGLGEIERITITATESFEADGTVTSYDLKPSEHDRVLHLIEQQESLNACCSGD